jgi:tetrahydromethanopterin S-methyltransferase subunit G
MEQARKTWNDDRLDALSSRMDERFAEVDQRFDHFERSVDQRFESFEKKVDQRFEQIDRRFNSIDSALHQIHRSMIVTLGSVLTAFVGLVAALRF